MSAEYVGKYKLLKKIATGGMAEIFLAETTGPGRFVKRMVIKRILPHLVGDEKFLTMFQDEANLAALMSHPNIVQIFDLGEESGSYYIAMEHVSGYNLRAIIQLSNKHGMWLAPEYIAKLGSQICEGLEYAHNFCHDGHHLHLIHRDVSPQNLILSTQGVIKVVDFGIAKAKSNMQETQAGIIKGKLAYMSPEQVKGQTLDRRSDLFSLGIVLFELATHTRPFHGKSDIDMLRAILESHPQPISSMRPDFPHELENIILRSLTKNREERYQSAREMLYDLERFIQSWGQPIGPFQLQELITTLKGLDQEENAAPEPTPAPAPAPPPHSRPTPPPPNPSYAAPPPPPVPKHPGAPEDFNNAKTAWSDNQPQSSGYNNQPMSYPPQNNAQPASPWNTPQQQQPSSPWNNNGQYAAEASLGGMDEWDDDGEVTILTGPGSSFPKLADMLPPKQDLGDSDLQTFNEPPAPPPSRTLIDDEAIPNNVVRNYLNPDDDQDEEGGETIVNIKNAAKRKMAPPANWATPQQTIPQPAQNPMPSAPKNSKLKMFLGIFLGILLSGGILFALMKYL